MAIRKIKSSKSEGEKLEEDINVRSVVEKTLKEVEVNGDKAVHELSKKFDSFERENFLSHSLKWCSVSHSNLNKSVPLL